MSGADPIGTLEDALLARLRGAFTLDGKSALKAVATLEHPFDGRTPASIALHAPGVFVVPLVARPTGTDRRLDLQWAIYCLSNAATPGARARGGTGAFGIGTYAIASRAVAALDGWLPETGTASALRVLGVENLTGLVLVKERMAVLAITLAGMIECEPGEDGTDLADFLTYHSDWDISPFVDPPDALPVEAPDATTTVTLEGASG